MKCSVALRILVVVVLLWLIAGSSIGLAQEPGVAGEPADNPPLATASISPIVTVTGLVSLSIDAVGTLSESGTVQVEKPAGATVMAAYLAAASTGWSEYELVDGDVKIDGADVAWDGTKTIYSTGVHCYNHWADVTTLVKPKVDGAPAGRVDFTIAEAYPYDIEGEVLAVIFADPGQATTNTIVLLFGAQDVLGDSFAIGLADPIDKSDPNLVLDLSLGISFGYQTGPTGQYSRVDVNGTRMTTSAGGNDDGEDDDGALITAGGLDDSRTNPADPYATDNGDPRQDDELYNLKPFVSNGDTSIHVDTLNPSNDDNIYFAALFLGATTAIVGEGIILGPTEATNPVGTEHTVTATVYGAQGQPVSGAKVMFEIISGPHAGLTHEAVTGAKGKARWTYEGVKKGKDVIIATSRGEIFLESNEVTKKWTPVPAPPAAPPFVPEASTLIMLGSALTGLAGYAGLQIRARRRK